MDLLAPIHRVGGYWPTDRTKLAALLRKRHSDKAYLRALTRHIARSERPALTAIAARKAMALTRDAKTSQPGARQPAEPVA